MGKGKLMENENESLGTDIDYTVRYEVNPFIENTVVKVRKKSVRIGSTNDVLLNTETGETSVTNIVAFKEVDDAMFVKLFTQNIGLTFNLSANGVKTLTVLIWLLQQRIGGDKVTLDKYTHEDFLIEHTSLKMAYATFSKGVTELCKSGIIAKTKRMGQYFTNPDFVFNGDRIRFVTEIRRKSANKQAKLEELGQKRLIE